MSSTKEIRIRIKAIGSTAKITKAMEMVAASKMKKSQDAALKNRAYATTSYEVLCNLIQDEKISHPLLSVNKNQEKKLLVVVSSDKGLCGAYNTAVIRKAMEYLKANPVTDLIAIGKKGQKLLTSLGKNIISAYTDFPIFAMQRDVAPIITRVSHDYQLAKYHEVTVCFTEFQSTLKQTPKLKKLMPFQPDEGATCKTDRANFKFEPSTISVTNYVVPRIIETQFYQMVLEAIASEQSARMMAMKNATDSAEDLIEDLELTYNGLRQDSITQELAEISAAVNN